MERIVVKHQDLVSYLILFGFYAAGVALGTWVHSSYSLLMLLGAALALLDFHIFYGKWDWVCSQCGYISIELKRENYCPSCGGKMIPRRATILAKYCENGHRIKDKFAKYCPICGTPLHTKKA